MRRASGKWATPGLVLAGAAAFLLTFSAPSSAQELNWTGCGITKKAFMAEVAAAYETKTGVKIALSGGGATKGIRATAAGTSDMGGACRHALLDDGGTIRADEKDAVLTQVAWDAVVFIVHPDNPVSDISLGNVKGIYDGRITSWKDLGGPDKKIALATRESKGSGVGHMLRLLAFNDADYEFKARSFKVKSTGPLERKVEGTETAMGADGVSSAKKSAVKILSVDGVAPTKENLSSGSYPLFRPLYIVTNKSASADVGKVVEFMLSPEGQEIIAGQGTVNLEEGKALGPIWEEKKKNFKL